MHTHTHTHMLHSYSSLCVQVAIVYLSSLIVIAIRVVSTKTTEGIPDILSCSCVVGCLATAIPE